MFYLVQENVFREENYEVIFQALNRLELEYEIVNLSDGSITYKTDRTDVFCFGSVRMARLALENKHWYPATFYGGNHDYGIYSQYYKDNLLNYDSVIKRIGDPIEWFDDEIKFIRPSMDSKIFNGGLFTKTKWEDVISNQLNNLHNPRFTEDSLIQIGVKKKIYKEARVWIVDGKVITSSYYQFGDYVEWSENVEPEGLDFAQKMADLYCVADAFVMDICLTQVDGWVEKEDGLKYHESEDQWKIVEINCINSAGFYKGDLQKILIALEDKYNPE